MAANQSAEPGEPMPRSSHSTAFVGGKLLLWGGDQRRLPRVHDSTKKREFLSRVDVFHLQTGEWRKHQPTTGPPPLGAAGYALAVIDTDLHYFGGWCGHGDCYHNSIHKLDGSLQWKALSQTATKSGWPMLKSHSGMVAFKDKEEHLLFVVGGWGVAPTSSLRQRGADYVEGHLTTSVHTNEQHIFSVKKNRWSSPSITGQSPPPSSRFTITSLDEKQAAMFGGSKGALECFCDIYVVELLSKKTVQWSKISKPVDRAVKWPEGRIGHVAASINGPTILISGGRNTQRLSEFPLDDFWICNTSNGHMMKLSLSYSVIRRAHHSVSVIQLGPWCVWLLVFGGWRTTLAESVACTDIIELVQQGAGDWSVGTVLQGAGLCDHQEYVAKLAEAKRKGKPRDVVPEHTVSTEQLQIIDVKQAIKEVLEESTQLQHRDNKTLAKQTSAELEMENMKLKEQVGQLQKQIADLVADREKMEKGEEKPHWVVSREEIEVTSEIVGTGGWGQVKVAKFRGLRIAAKCLHQVILSEYNLRMFTREMNIAAKLRHPNLHLFIGATREGNPLILTELLPTSLFKEIQKTKLANRDIASISCDVASALCYLHQWRPHPIIHRDISSGNILLEPLSKGWRAKLSDYGSANFMNLVCMSVNPGCPAYAAPEAGFPSQHSPKMDVFSFGVLLLEMCANELPESTYQERESQIQWVQWPAMVSLIRKCTSEVPTDRPDISDILPALNSMSEHC